MDRRLGLVPVPHFWKLSGMWPGPRPPSGLLLRLCQLYREVADRSARTAHHFADLPGYVHAGHLPEPNLSYKQRGLIKKVGLA